MKTVTFVPTVCKGEDALFEGSLVLKMPTFDQKYELFELAGMKVSEKGEMQMDTVEKMRMMRMLVKHTQPYYETVSIKKKDGGEEFKSFEDLQYDQDAHAILIEVGTAILNGFKLGN